MGAIIWVVSVDSFTGLKNPYAEIREFLRVYAPRHEFTSGVSKMVEIDAG